ncbi:LysR family transcriptional regulator [Ottowia thiooxydans]|uniref:LysR family transcriptional regulator n=1 Tax=Ottowia thiooxydans TaxID=219182 RepID=UPI00041344E9|nr:LysR family transcriptional regulator [Ottowia thiooxydans]
MDLRKMRYFLALAQERNFARAAVRLHMTQPPLTRQIRALEEDIGVQLFTRTSKGVDLTEAGQTLLKEVPNLLSLARRAEERTLRAGQGLTGKLEVGIFTASVLDVIPSLLARFHSERPDVQIGLRTMTKIEQLEALRERRIHVGFNRFVPASTDIAVDVVLREKFVVGLHENHPLCAKREITLRDLEDEPMILYPNQPIAGLAQEISSAFQRENVRMRVEQEVEDVLTCIALVSAGFGVCITTAPAMNLGLPHMVYKPLKSRTLRDAELACLYRSDDRSPVMRAFLDVVEAFRSGVGS